MTRTTKACTATNIKKDYRVTIIFVWLLVLTIINIYGIMNIDKKDIKVQRVYDLPPIEVLEVDLERGDI